MDKYKFELKVVQEYFNSTLGYRELTKKYEISNKRLIDRWVTQYKAIGNMFYMIEGRAKQIFY